MEEARKFDLRPVLAVGAVVAVFAVMLLWAAGAFAAGGSSSNDSPGNAPPALIQAGEEGQAPSREDCPEGRGGGSGGDGNGAPEGNTDGSGSSDL
jgi:hypothetical protein